MTLSSNIFEARLTRLRYVHTYTIECDKRLKLTAVLDEERPNEDLIPVALISEARQLSWLNEQHQKFWDLWFSATPSEQLMLSRDAGDFAKQFAEQYLRLEFIDPQGPHPLRVGAQLRLILTSQNPNIQRSKVLEEGAVSKIVQLDL